MNKDLIQAMEDFEKIIHRADDLIDELRMVNNRMKDRLQTIKWAADKSSKSERPEIPGGCRHPRLSENKVCYICGEVVF